MIGWLYHVLGTERDTERQKTWLILDFTPHHLNCCRKTRGSNISAKDTELVSKTGRGMRRCYYLEPSPGEKITNCDSENHICNYNLQYAEACEA